MNVVLLSDMEKTSSKSVLEEFFSGNVKFEILTRYAGDVSFLPC